jgi:hypothetical protein
MKKLYFFILAIVNISAFSQQKEPIKYVAESGFLVSTSKQTPFWLRTNQNGFIPFESQFATFRGGLKKDYSDSTKKIKYGYGSTVALNVGRVNEIIIPELYIKVKFKALQLYAGRRQEIVGLVDSTLSSGSYAWSGNALPLPKIDLSIPEYTPVLAKGLVSLKGNYTHGWFGKEYYLKNVFLHQKTLYGRFGRPSWKFKFYTGFNHQVQWGGKVNNITTLTTTNSNNIPSSFNDYIYLATGISLNTEKQRKKIDQGNYNEFDLTNRIGNHIGSIDVGFEYNFSNLQLMFYRQSIYDDGSLFYLANIRDGLTGITLKNNNKYKAPFTIKQLNVEYLNTSDQGGPLGPEQTIPYIRGSDNYFNHAQFLDGWAYNDFTVGTPFIPPSKSLPDDLPKYVVNNVAERSVNFFTNNNRAKVWHLGVLGAYKKVDFQSKISYSTNLGSYPYPFSYARNQFSTLFNVSFPVNDRGLSIIGSFAYDYGDLYPDNQGIMIILRKSWN